MVFEAHPRLLGLHPVLFWAPLPFVLIISTALAYGASTSSGNGTLVVLVVGSMVFDLPFLAVMAYAVVSAHRTTYALTDQRAILRYGDESVSVPYDQIRDVTSPARSSRVVFTLQPNASLPRSRLFRTGSPSLVWKAVLGAPAVASFSKSASQYYRLRLQQTQIRQELIKASIEDKIACQYCGRFVLLKQLNPENPRCPNCSAPIVVAPVGVY